MAATRRAKSGTPELETPVNGVSQLDLITFFHKNAVHELVVVEIAPGHYRMEAIISWRVGRWTLMGARGPRNFRSLDTLAKHLKTMGLGRTVTRLELLT